jgi:hypothetical protein
MEKPVLSLDLSLTKLGAWVISRPALDLFLGGYKMPRMSERLRALLGEIGPGPIVAGALLALLALALLALSIFAIRSGSSSSVEETTQRGAGPYTTVSESRSEDFPLIFGPGASRQPSKADSDAGRQRGIPGLSEMDVVGDLQYLPGTDFSCPGGGPDRGRTKRICRSSTADDPAVYEVTLVEENPRTVLSVVATAQDAPDDEAARVLGYVAGLSLKGAAPIDADSWVRRNLSSGGQYSADGAEVRLYGVEGSRTLEIVATAPPPVDVGSETTRLIIEETTAR